LRLAAALPAAGLEAARLSHHWFFSADPTRYHWDTLFVKGKDLWSDIRDAASQRYLKQVHRGDKVVCYHGPPDRMVYALATVASDPYPPADERKKRSLIVDLKANERLPRTVPLKEMKLDRALRRMKFLARPRLAVSPLNEHEYNEILRLAGVLVSPYR
jgi:predicted RNA-binding protein with PUA-like domain